MTFGMPTMKNFLRRLTISPGGSIPIRVMYRESADMWISTFGSGSARLRSHGVKVLMTWQSDFRNKGFKNSHLYYERELRAKFVTGKAGAFDWHLLFLFYLKFMERQSERYRLEKIIDQRYSFTSGRKNASFVRRRHKHSPRWDP